MLELGIFVPVARSPARSPMLSLSPNSRQSRQENMPVNDGATLAMRLCHSQLPKDQLIVDRKVLTIIPVGHITDKNVNMDRSKYLTVRSHALNRNKEIDGAEYRELCELVLL
ncbi:hypothetical protein FS837_007014 [Tulasnella sp. UAMH 9824]|nr:hypothetical protein FS837_007014 [Tulasnella sp. UAMH 9824]